MIIVECLPAKKYVQSVMARYNVDFIDLSDMTDFANIFQNTAFPVAVCVVLFGVLYSVLKRELKQNDDALQIVKDANDKHLSYLQNQNERLTQIISECTKALDDNTVVFKKLLFVLEQKKVPD